MEWTVGTALENGNYVIDGIVSHQPFPIYAATQIMTGQSVWLKPIAAIAPDYPNRAEAAQAYINTLQNLGQQEHSAILLSLSAFQAEGKLILVQPTHPPTVAQYLACASPFTEAQALHHLDQLFAATQFAHQLKLPGINLDPHSLRFDATTACLYVAEFLPPLGLIPSQLKGDSEQSAINPAMVFKGQGGADAKTAAQLLIYLLTGMWSDASGAEQLDRIRQHQSNISDALITALTNALTPTTHDSFSLDNQRSFFPSPHQTHRPISDAGEPCQHQAETPFDGTQMQPLPLQLPHLPQKSSESLETATIQDSAHDKPDPHPEISTAVTPYPRTQGHQTRHPTTQNANRSPQTSTNPAKNNAKSPASKPRPLPILFAVACVAALVGIGCGSLLRFSGNPETSGVRLSPEQAFPPQANWPVEDSTDDTEFYDESPGTPINQRQTRPEWIEPTQPEPSWEAEADTLEQPLQDFPSETDLESDSSLERNIPPLDSEGSSNLSEPELPEKLSPAIEDALPESGESDPPPNELSFPEPTPFPASETSPPVEPDGAAPAPISPQASRIHQES